MRDIIICFVTSAFAMAYKVAERVCLIENYFPSGSYSKTNSAAFELNPSAPVPHDSTIKRLIDKFRETGSAHDRRCSGRPSLDDEDVAAVQGALLRSPQKSLRIVSQQINRLALLECSQNK